ncbi:type VII secretion-associated protein [Corynebacterium confusum]|uniref:type VII secretion-associated protein n=1 Tax=Corynebacterium confusum TaxID=71254 RepID=UPI0025B5FCBC|nr:type VII secretion-associated protein [Corynebacterium confusum]WJY89014.1 hypothetical protein CCONF_02275 [Corynebacterium confusum]
MTTAAPALLTITILDTATIFEGPETVYRYDLPGTGIVEGWALDGALEQAEKILGAHWPEASIKVCADSSATAVSAEAVSIITRQLEGREVPVVDTNEHAVSHPATEVFAPLAPAADATLTGGSHQDAPRAEPLRPKADDSAKSGWFQPFYALLAVVVLIVAGVAWFVVGRGGDANEESAGGGATDNAVAAAPAGQDAGPPAPGEAGSDGPANEPPPAPEQLNAAGLSVQLPQGFHAEESAEGDGLVTATGPDPDLRVLFAADPLYSVPADYLLEQIQEEIADDDALSHPQEHDGRLTYVEKPGDDSHVVWATWVDGDHQLSVGCHTRELPSVAQKAACRMAEESLVREG